MRPATAALGLALLMVAVAFAIPARPAQAADLTGQYGGNLRVALLAAPSWSPTSTDPADGRVHNLVWDTLARPDPATQEPKPWAALSWTAVQDTGTNNGNITVVPRPGMMWSDGTPITTTDLVYTFRTGHGFDVSASGSNIVFRFTDPDGNGPILGGAGNFTSRALYAWIAWDSTGARRYSGMFVPATGNTNLLQANTHYWAGRPFVDSVTLVIASSVDDAACKLLKNRATSLPPGATTVDFLGFSLLPNDLTDERACTAYGGFTGSGGNPLNKSLVNANASRAEPHVSSVHNPGPRFLYYWLDVSVAGPMTDVNFRRGLYLLVNKQSAAQIEPSSKVTHSLISREEVFWFLTSWEVVRDAGFTTIRDPAGTPRQDTNPFAGAQALDTAGYLDRNGDGWRETPTGAPLVLRVGSLGFLGSPDPRKATIAGAFVDVLQRQGVNAVHVQFTSWADLRNAEATHAVDVSLETYDPITTNPRFLETFAPLTTAASLLTDTNARNVATHLNLGKNSFTSGLRALHYNHVTYYNSLCACVLPVLHYESLEVYDRQAFSGWVDSFGGIDNVWSFANAKQPTLGALTISISSFSRSVPSEGSTTVQVAVSDSSGAAVQGASVSLSGTAGTLSPTTGVTDSNGRFQAQWTAPPVTQDWDVTVTATVTKPQYTGGTVWTGLTARAPFRPLEVTVTLADAVLNSSVGTSVQVSVRTSGGAGVGDADVSMSVSLPGGQLLAYSGRTGSCPSTTCGTFSTTFKGYPTVRSIYRIDASASKAGYAPGSGAGSVIVTPPQNTADQFQRVTVTVPGFETLAVIGAIGAAIAILRWRSRREG